MAEKVRALCAVLAAVAAVAGAQKAPPASDVLPDSWTATISANIYQPGRSKAYTLSRDEWYDRNQSRVRIDEAQPFGSLTQIAQFSSNTTRVYSVVFTDEAPQGFCQVCFSSKDDLKSQSQPHTCIVHGSTLCFVQAKDEEARENLQSRFYTGDSGFLRSTREFFNYPDNPDDTLNFVTETSPFASFRGVRELWWEYSFSIPDSDASYTLYYGFSEDSWSFPNEDRQSPRLQAIILNGTSPPRDEENEPKAVHHSYEFYDLRPLGAVDAGMLDPCMLAKDNAACGCGGSNPRAFGCTWAVKEFPDQFNDDEQLDENQCTGPEYWAFSSCTANTGNGNLHASLATTANPYSPETPKSERLNKSIIAVRYKDDRELSEPDLQACVVDAQLPIDASATEYDNSDAAAEVRGCTDLEPSADSLGVFISRYPNSSLPEVIPPGASTAEQAGSERFLAISFTNGTTIGLCALIPQAPALPDVWTAGIERNRIVQDASSNSDEGNGTTEYFKEAFSAVQNRVRYDTGNSSATRVVIEVPSANTEYVLTKSAENNYRGTCELRATGEESRLEQTTQSISSTSDAFNFYDDNVEYLGRIDPRGIPGNETANGIGIASLRGIETEYWRRAPTDESNITFLYEFSTFGWAHRYRPQRRRLTAIITSGNATVNGSDTSFLTEFQLAGLRPLSSDEAETVFNPCSVFNNTIADTSACGCNASALTLSAPSKVSTSKQSKDEQVYTNGEVAGIAFLGIFLGASITTAAYFVGLKIHQRRMEHRQFTNEI